MKLGWRSFGPKAISEEGPITVAITFGNSIALSANALIDGLVRADSWHFGGGPPVPTCSLSLNTDAVAGSWSLSPGFASAVTQATTALTPK